MTLPVDPHPPIAKPAALAGCWKLAAGHAVTLAPHRPGVLRIAHGRVWATLQGPHAGRGNESGDLFLAPGQPLTLAPGQRLVIEPWLGAASAPDAAVWFSWDYLADTVTVAAPGGSRWQVLAQPLHDLRLAAALGVDALTRLLLGLAGVALGRGARGHNGTRDLLGLSGALR